jgi:hypothetical protein
MPLVLQPPLLDLYGNYEYGEQLDEGILNGILLDTRPNMATLSYDFAIHSYCHACG